MIGSRRSLLLGIILILVFFFTGGFFVNNYFIGRNKIILQKELSDLTNIAAAAINADRVANLSGTPNDINSPDYIRLREQFQKIGDALKSQGIYEIYLTKKMKDGTLMFLVDSLPPKPRMAYRSGSAV